MDPCEFWNAFCDVNGPDPSEKAGDAIIERMVAHAIDCKECETRLSPFFDFLERELGGSKDLGDDARSRRAANLLIIVITHGPSDL